MKLQLKYFCFASYLIVKFFVGAMVNSFGSIIIYFTKVTHENETHYSFIFLARGIGYLMGGLFAKVLVKHFSYHTIFLAAIISCGSALIVSSVDFGFWNLSITMFVIGATCCILQILCNLCTFQIFFKDNQDFWFQLLSLFFPIGGLIGPIIVLYTQQLGLRAIGILSFMTIAPIFMLNSPEKKQKSNEQIQKRQKQLQLPTNIEVGLCLLIFIYFGFVMFYPSWSPTYGVQSGALNASQANALASIYWIVNIVSKVIMLFVKDTVQSRIFFQLKTLTICAIIAIILQLFGQYKAVCYFGVVSISFFSSGLFPLFYTIAPSYGYKLSPSNLANLTICTCIGEGLLVTPIGYAMGHFGYKAFIYSIFIIICLMFLIFGLTNRQMERHSKENKQIQQIQS